MTQFRWIEDADALRSWCATQATSGCIAVDTEFVRTNTFYPRPGLIQLATHNDIALIDPIVIPATDLQPLGDFLFAPERTLIMHSPGEDLEVFMSLWQRVPERLLDTQIAAALLGQDRQVGLQRLLTESLAVEIEKGETRSDWTQRPLRAAQLRYAAQDVEFLLPLWALLQERLQQLQRLDWFEEECALKLAKSQSRPLPERYYLGIGAGWKLNPRQQAVLKRLAAWREETAHARNVPRNHIARDAMLIALAQHPPKGRAGLTESGLQPQQVRKYGDGLLTQLQLGTRDDPVAETITPPLNKSAQGVYKQLKNAVAQRAEQLQLAPELLASKAQLVEYLRWREECPAAVNPFADHWRAAEVQPALDAQSWDPVLQASSH